MLEREWLFTTIFVCLSRFSPQAKLQNLKTLRKINRIGICGYCIILAARDPLALIGRVSNCVRVSELTPAMTSLSIL